MRVSFLSVSDQLGGSEGMLLQVLAELRRARPAWAFSVVVPGAGPLAAAARLAGASVSVVPMPPALRRLGEWAAAGRVASLAWRGARVACALPGYERALRRAVEAFQPDVIHSNGFKAHILGARMAPRQAVVWHMHEYVAKRPLTRRLVARYASSPRVIVANSRSVAEDVAGVVRVPVETVHNAVDLARFSPDGALTDLDAAAGLPAAPPGTVRVGLVATFSRWKGHQTFLRALASLPRELPVRGYVVGGAVYDTAGSQYSLGELQRLAVSVGLGSRLGFTGFLSPVEHAMRALDVIVHASTDPEPFGLVVAEAMACGRPLITTAAGGASELVDDGEMALRYRAGDESGLAEAIARLVKDEALRVRMGASGRGRALARFDARRLGVQFADIYARAVAGRESRCS